VKRAQITLTNDGQFLETVEYWIGDESEVLGAHLVFAQCGSKSFECFMFFDRLREGLEELPPETCVTIQQSQLPLRGIVEDDFKALRGKPVAVGIYPPWREDSSDIVSAYVPGQDGRARFERN